MDESIPGPISYSWNSMPRDVDIVEKRCACDWYRKTGKSWNKLPVKKSELTTGQFLGF